MIRIIHVIELSANNLANREALLEEDVRISGPLTKVGIGDFPRFKTLFVIHQNSTVGGSGP